MGKEPYVGHMKDVMVLDMASAEEEAAVISCLIGSALLRLLVQLPFKDDDKSKDEEEVCSKEMGVAS